MVLAVSTKSAGALYCRNSPGTPTGKKYALLASVKSTVPTRPRYSSNRMPAYSNEPRAWPWRRGPVSLFATLLALMLVAAGAPAWLAVLVFAAHIPWNLVLLVGVWRSAGRPEVSPAAASLTRLIILAWVVALCVL